MATRKRKPRFIVKLAEPPKEFTLEYCNLTTETIDLLKNTRKNEQWSVNLPNCATGACGMSGWGIGLSHIARAHITICSASDAPKRVANVRKVLTTLFLGEETELTLACDGEII